MAIESVDQAYKAAGLASRVQDRTYMKTLGTTLNTTDPPIHLWRKSGCPGAGTYAGDEAAQVITNATAGALGFTDAGSGRTRHLQSVLGRVLTTTVTSGDDVNIVLIDHLVHYAGIEATDANPQAMTNSPANPLPRYQDGQDVQMFAVADTNIGTGTPTVIVTYDDQDGNSSQTPSFTLANINADFLCMSNNNFFMPLASGDRGVKRVTSVDLTGTATAGTFAIVLFKLIGIYPLKRFVQSWSHLFGPGGKLAPILESGAALDAILLPANTSALGLAGVSLNLSSLEG